MVQRVVSTAVTRWRESEPDSGASRKTVIAEDAIQVVVDNGGPATVFQPICRAADRRPVGFEALSRFPTTIDAAGWFAAATAAGMGGTLEIAAARNALAHAVHLPPEVFVSVNLSPSTLLTEPTVIDMLTAATTSGRAVVVEITETVAIDVTHAFDTVLSRLRAAGVAIALDDVGAGYAGLRQLLTVKPDMMKVDAFITRRIDVDPARQAIARSMVQYARSTGTTCVFEGVETPDELRVVIECGGELVQGFLLGRPMTAKPDPCPRHHPPS